MILAQGAFLIQCHPSCKSYEFREQQWLIEFWKTLWGTTILILFPDN